MRFYKVLFLGLAFVPMILFAQDGTAKAHQLVGKINDAILFPLITLLSAVALVVFLYGVFEFVRGSSNDTAREKGKKHILYGTIGLLVMLSAFTILSIAAATFGLDGALEDASKSPSTNSIFP